MAGDQLRIWTTSFVLAEIAGVFILILLYIYLYYLEKKVYILMWQLALCAFLIKSIFTMLYLNKYNPVYSFGADMMFLSSCVLFSWGIYHLLGKKYLYPWILIAIASTLYNMAGFIFRLPDTLFSLSWTTTYGVIFVWIGFLIIWTGINSILNKQYTGCIFLMGILHVVIYPFIKPNNLMSFVLSILDTFIVLSISSVTFIYLFHRLRKDLNLSENRYKILVESLPYGIYLENNNHITFANKEGIHLLGVQHIEQILGEELGKHIVKENYNQRDNFQNARTLTPRPYKTTLKQLNGQVLDIEATTILIPDGQHYSYLSVVRDITEEVKAQKLQKAMEENTKRLNETIEYDKIKTEFFANMSHELRTPLNIILSTIQLFQLYLKENAFIDNTKKVNKLTQVMKQNCYRLLRLFNNLIDATKIDGGFYEIKLQNCNIISIVEDITLSVAENARQNGLNVIFDTEVEEKITACDPDKIERIMMNLLSNAIKFTPLGGCITVNIYDKNNSLKISVKDSGIGIPKDKLNSIFERFKQIEGNYTKNHSGSGIGLSLVKSLVELHHGTVRAVSEVGLGTEFIIELPVKYIENEVPENTSPGHLEPPALAHKNYIERINIEFSDIYHPNKAGEV